jgi:hypothetical protein
MTTSIPRSKKAFARTRESYLIAKEASNATERLTTTAQSLTIVLSITSISITGSPSITTTTTGGRSSSLGRRILAIFPLQLLIQRGVIDQTPSIQEIKNPTNGPHIAYESLPDFSKSEFGGRVFPELGDD